MRRLLFKQDMNIKIGSCDMPVVGYNDALVKVHACGVCGSDIHVMHNSEEWIPLGHEISGEVVQIGAGVTGVREGSHVVVEDRTACGVCDNCKAGHAELCLNMLSLGAQGGMGEYLSVDSRMLNSFSGLTYEEAALTEPLGVAYNTLLTAKVPTDGKLVIFGLGPIALMIIALAKYKGVRKVICVGSRSHTKRNQFRSKKAKELGADSVVYMEDSDWMAAVHAGIGGSIDRIIVTSPPRTVPYAMETADYGTRVIIIGLDMGTSPKAVIDIDRMVQNKNPIVPFIAEPARYFPQCIELIKEMVINPNDFISNRISMERAPEELSRLLRNDVGFIKAVVTM